MFAEQYNHPIRLVIDPEWVAEVRAARMRPDAGVPIEPWIDSAGTEYGYCCGDDEGYYAHIHDVGGFVFDAHSPVVRGAPKSGRADAVFHEIFCSDILPLVLQHHRWEVLHACGLEVCGACVALSGRSQSGKSTLAYAWRRRGARVYADDALPFRVESERIVVNTIPFRIRLRKPSSQHFAALDGGLTEGAATDPRRGERTDLGSAPLTAVFMLERRPESEGGVRIERLVPQRAVAELLRQAYCLTMRNPTRNRQMVDAYLALADRVPAFRLSYPTCLKRTDAILNHLVASVAELGDVGAKRS